MKRIALLVVCLVIALGLAIGIELNSGGAAGTFADPSMQQVWNRTDLPVEQLRASRTWMWGPGSFDSRQEPYEQGSGGSRLVSYFDKSRMEVTNPNGDRNSQWFVTNGLLTKELITGQLQKGDAAFESRTPAQIPVAGDQDDPNGPTYATFAGLLSKPAHSVGDQLTETVNRNGDIGGGGPGGVSAAYLVPETNHTVSSVFWDFLDSSGMVYDRVAYRQGKLFDPVFFATGFPITEAYWSQVKVAGQTKWVLIQVFERRVMTYTPDNKAGWQVEMGNIGRHYHQWRYGDVGGPISQPTVQPTQQPTAEGTGTVVGRILWNDKPMAGVAVKLCADWSIIGGCRTTGYEAVTGNDGRYTITGIPTGEYDFATQLPDQQNETGWMGLTVTVVAGQTFTVRDVEVVKYDLKLSSPGDNATVSTTKPTLTWEAYPGAAYYKVYVAGAVMFEKVATTQYTIANPLAPGEYYWKVYAYNAAVTKIAESAGFDFVVAP